MSIISQTLFNLIFKIQVIHSLPGRLRISLPQIKNLSQHFRQEEEIINSIFLALPGIENIVVSYLAGTALINYNPNVTNEKKILAYLKKILSIIYRNQKDFTNLSLTDVKKEIKRIINIVQQEVKNQTVD